MILACLADCHLDQRLPYWDDHVTALRRIITDAADHHVDAFLLAGDMAGRDAPHRLTDLERETWADLLIEMADHAPVYGLTGNHCHRGAWGIMERLRSEAPILIATEPVTYHHSATGGKDWWHIAMRPYMTQPEISGLNDLPIAERNTAAGRLVLGKGDAHTICVAHFPAEGASCGSYEVQSAQDVTLTRRALDESGYAFVLLGHLHQRQQVADRAWFAGSPVPLSHGESGPKGYLLVELVTGEPPRVMARDIPSWDMRTIRVPMDAAGRYEKLIVSARYDHTHFRVIVELPADFHGAVPRREITDLLTRAGALSVRVDTEQAERERSRSAAVVAATTDDDRLRAALAEQQIVDAEADRLVGVSADEVRRAEEGSQA